MADIPHRVSTTYATYFDYATASLAQSDFTIEVDKDGVNAATTGITITYIAGRRYYVTVNGSTGFAAATGVYKLTIYKTATPNDRWQDIIRVTTDGSLSGTVGTNAFTSTTGDGRVTDGSSALANARVYINRPGGTYYTSLLTNSLGNWGPVYFDADGTWTLSVQIAGYTIGTGTITVSSGLPTGPGVDIALSANTSTTLTASSLVAYARRMYRDRTGAKADAELYQIVNEALMMMATTHDWPWYETVGRVNLKAAYSTGTVTLVNGDATAVLASGTWPSWIGTTGPAELYINGLYHRVLSRTSDTDIEMVNAWGEASAAGVSYTIAQVEYTLPSDLMKLGTPTAANDWIWGPDPVSRFTIEEARRCWSIGSSTSTPRLWAIERDRLVLWPWPGADKMMNILYYRRPTELVNGTDTVDWDTNLIELLHRAIDYQVSCRGDCVAGDKTATYNSFKESMTRNIGQDRTATTRRPGFQNSYYDDLRRGATISG